MDVCKPYLCFFLSSLNMDMCGISGFRHSRRYGVSRHPLAALTVGELANRTDKDSRDKL